MRDGSALPNSTYNGEEGLLSSRKGQSRGPLHALYSRKCQEGGRVNRKLLVIEDMSHKCQTLALSGSGKERKLAKGQGESSSTFGKLASVAQPPCTNCRLMKRMPDNHHGFTQALSTGNKWRTAIFLTSAPRTSWPFNRHMNTSDLTLTFMHMVQRNDSASKPLHESI